MSASKIPSREHHAAHWLDQVLRSRSAEAASHCLLCPPASTELIEQLRHLNPGLLPTREQPQGIWLDGRSPLPWLSSPWPDGLAEALRSAEGLADFDVVCADWCARNGVWILITGGTTLPATLQPGASAFSSSTLRILWLPDEVSGDLPGWTLLDAPQADLDPPPSSDCEGPIRHLAAIDASFTAALARHISAQEDLDLEELAAAGCLERLAAGRWRIREPLRQRLLAQSSAEDIDATKTAWCEALIHGWPPDGTNTVSIGANLEEATKLWQEWFRTRRHQDWARIVNAWNRWARQHGEHLRVRCWHQAMLSLCETRDQDAASRAQLMVAISRCEGDLGRYQSAETWVERGMALLPATHPFRVTGYLQQATLAMVGGQLDQAIAVTQRALELAEDIGMSLIDQAAMQADLGFFFLLAGRPGEAEAPLRAAIFAKKSSSGRVSFTHDLNVLAMLMIALERPDESVAAAREAVEQAFREQHADVTPYALHGLAMALLASDQAAAAYDAAVEAMSNLVPAVHKDLRPLLDLTLFRAEAQLGGEGRGLSDTLDRLEEILDEELASTSYAGVLLLELMLEANLADRGANLLDALTEQALEGHVAAMIRRITQRMASSPSAPAKAPMASEQECLRLEVLAERVLASISKLERHA